MSDVPRRPNCSEFKNVFIIFLVHSIGRMSTKTERQRPLNEIKLKTVDLKQGYCYGTKILEMTHSTQTIK